MHPVILILAIILVLAALAAMLYYYCTRSRTSTSQNYELRKDRPVCKSVNLSESEISSLAEQKNCATEKEDLFPSNHTMDTSFKRKPSFGSVTVYSSSSVDTSIKSESRSRKILRRFQRMPRFRRNKPIPITNDSIEGSVLGDIIIEDVKFQITDDEYASDVFEDAHQSRESLLESLEETSNCLRKGGTRISRADLEESTLLCNGKVAVSEDQVCTDGPKVGIPVSEHGSKTSVVLEAEGGENHEAEDNT